MKQPGQFVHIKVGEGSLHMLRRPISICHIEPEIDTFTMLYRAEGAGTQRLSEMKADDTIDIIAPLGNGFPIEKQNVKLY